MRGDFFVEWLLTRFTDRPRAASIVGDLREASVQKGSMWFWWSVTGVMFSVAWRLAGGFLLAAFGGGFATSVISSSLYAGFGVHAPNVLQQSWTTSLAAMVGFGLMIACYSAIRFGVRDALSQLAISFSLIGTMAVCFWWLAMTPYVAAAAAFALFMVVMFFRNGRRAVAALAILLVLQVFVWMIGITVFAALFRRFLLADEPMLRGLLFASYFLLVWLVCAACGWIHRLLIKSGDRTDGPPSHEDLVHT